MPIINIQPETRTEPHPCLLGLHLWAWLVSGGQECYRYGVTR